MSKIKIGTSPLTNVIYAGKTKVQKGHELWVGEKQDVTMDCLLATIEHCLKFGDTVQIEKSDGTVDFEIDVKDLRK